MLYAVTACALVVVVALAGASGVAAGQLAGPAPAGIEIGSDWTGTAASIGKTWVGLVAFVTLTGAIAVLTRSTAAGMAFGLGYYVAEGILVRLLSAIFDWFETVAEYLPIRNINALAGGNSSLLPAGLDSGTTVEPLQAGIVLCGYIVVFGGFAALVFAKRDVVGASGR
jgi:ABC-type transport system involved in multi-copper enzyme maturation permease subunit